MPIWITQSGTITSAMKGRSYSFPLECNTSNLVTTFTLLSGKLPDGLSLSGPLSNPILPLPSIWGMPSPDCSTGNYTFTVRALDSAGAVADRGFTIPVSDSEPAFIFPNANLGIYPDGQWMFASIEPLEPTSLTGNILITSGQLPANLSLNGETGLISGYVSPTVLYNTPPIYENIESGAPNVCGSANTATFTFAAQYDSENTANYSITVMRTDLFQP